MGSQTIPPSPEVDRAEVHWEDIPHQRRRPQKSRASDYATEHDVNATFYGTSVGIEGERLPGFVKEFTAWDVYNNESKKVDDELVKDWTVSLNFLLVFVRTMPLDLLHKAHISSGSHFRCCTNGLYHREYRITSTGFHAGTARRHDLLCQ